MTNLKIRQMIAKAHKIELEIEALWKTTRPKGTTLRALANKKQDSRLYKNTKKTYIQKLDQLRELCDKLKNHIDSIEQEHANSEKNKQPEQDPAETLQEFRDRFTKGRSQISNKTPSKRVRSSRK